MPDGRGNHNIFINKKCQECDYTMRHVTPRCRFCKKCVAAKFSKRMRLASTRAKLRTGRAAADYNNFVAVIDAELESPTCYWESVNKYLAPQ